MPQSVLVKHSWNSAIWRWSAILAVLAVGAGCSSGAAPTPGSDEASQIVADDAGGANSSNDVTNVELPSLSPGRIDAESPDPSTVVPTYLTYQVISTRPHDDQAFTQGLELDNGQLFESTGSPGYTPLNTTTIRELDPESGEVLRSRDFGREYFGEGLTIVDDTLIQLTWQAEVAYLFDRNTFESTGTFPYEGEGWGLCYDGTNLMMSDGSSTLYKRDPTTFAVIDTVTVTRAGREVALLNELECVGDAVWANVWHSDEIVKIDPRNGAVLEVLDLTDLAVPFRAENAEFVLNGITYDPSTDRFLVTGKNWSQLYEIALVAVDDNANLTPNDSSDVTDDGSADVTDDG